MENVSSVQKEVYIMIVRLKDLSGAARTGVGAAGLNMQHNVRGRAEGFGIEPLAMVAADRRNGARHLARSRSRSGCNCGARRAEMVL